MKTIKIDNKEIYARTTNIRTEQSNLESLRSKNPASDSQRSCSGVNRIDASEDIENKGFYIFNCQSQEKIIIQ